MSRRIYVLLYNITGMLNYKKNVGCYVPSLAIRRNYRVPLIKRKLPF